jgi:hypothetical protein
VRDPVTVEFLRSGVIDSLGTGWRQDAALVSGGPHGTIHGSWRDDVLCLFRINWNTPEVGDTAQAGQEPQYIADVGCERLPNRVAPGT